MVGFTSDVYLGVDSEEIGVIAPYKAQSRAIRELLNVAKLSDVSVGSVEQFQGQVQRLTMNRRWTVLIFLWSRNEK